ncbi:MAG: YfhO family protein [Lachnospiraceae bacterium]|nr:YfhO family protein [Lachnospiraceae bacterium]
MNKIQKIINKETLLYLIFGILTTVVDFTAYLILTNFSVNYLIANVLSWILAVIFAFVTNKIFVFNSKNKDKSTVTNEILDFFSARIFSLAFSLVFIYTTVTLLNMNDVLAKIIASVFVVIINYVLSKFFIFSDNSEQNNRGTVANFIFNNGSFLVAFIIPLILLIIIYYMRSIYPFGDNMYLRSDCYHQYAPFMKEFFNKIKEGRDLSYSWNIGLGVNFSALYAYYLASPLNWLIGLVSENHITEAMSVFIIVKTSLCSLTFAYYLSKHFNTKKLSIASLSVFYALSSYFCAFSWNLMWLDCLVLLPLIVLGLEKLVKENKCYLYCISLGIAILSNYYIGIMLCIFSVLYYVALIYASDEEKTLKYMLIKFKNFAVYSLLAGGIAAISFIPAYCALSSTASGEFNFPKTIITYFSILDIFSRSLINVEPAIFSAHDPNVYCGVIVLLLVPLYVINPKINYKEKVAKISIIAFMLISFNTNIPNYIWHGFHYPNSLPARESFIYIFMVLSVSYEALFYIKEVTKKQLLSCFAGAIALILIIEELYVSDTYSSLSIYFSILFLIFYLIVISLMRNNNFKQIFVSYLLIIMVIAEVHINTDETAISTCTRSSYLNDNKAIEKLVNKADENEDKNNFYRIEKEYRRSKNDAAWSDYFGASTFSSTANAGLSEYYGSLGFEESTNAYAYYGHTPLTEAMFSIKYVLSTNSLKENKYRTLFDKESYKSSNNNEQTYYMYENNYHLPLGFMMPKDIEITWDNSNANPFVVQNNLASALTDLSADESPMYTRLNVTTIGEDNEVYLETDTHLFIYITTSLDSINVKYTDPEGNSTSKNFYSMTHKHILDLGIQKAGSAVTVSSTDDEKPSLQMYAYSFDDEVFEEAFNKLNESTLELTSFEETLVTGKINVKSEGLLYTSIPYDKGWKVYVDGKEAKTHAFKNALLSVELSEGEHEITFEYSPSGLKIGIFITFLSFIILTAIIITDILKKKHKKTSSEVTE